MTHERKKNHVPDPTTNVVRRARADPDFYKHKPCRYCGSTDVVANEDDLPRTPKPPWWRCLSCSEMIPWTRSASPEG
jgi:hypothetical protein